MKKETKNNDNDDDLDFARLEFTSNKKYQSKPTLEIVIKKEIKDYENNRPTPIATRNKLRTRVKHLGTFSNDSNLNNTINQPKTKFFTIYTLNKITSPVKKNTNTLKIKKINTAMNRNLTESKPTNMVRIIKSSISPPMEYGNIKDLKSNNTLLSQNFDYILNNKSALIYKLFNINNNKKNKNAKEIKNCKKNIKSKENERYIKDYINKKIFSNKHGKRESHNENIDFSPNANANIDNNIINKTKNRMLFSGSKYSNDDLSSVNKLNSPKDYESLFLSNSGINNRLMNSENSLTKDFAFKTEYNENKIKSAKKDVIRHNNKFYLSRNKKAKKIKKGSNKKSCIINYDNLLDSKKYLDFFENSNGSNLDLYLKCKTNRNNNDTNINMQSIEDFKKMKESYDNLEKLNNELNLLNKNLISENNKLKLQIINFSTNIYNNSNIYDEEKDIETNKTKIKKLKKEISKLSEENEILKTKNSPDKVLLEQYNKAMEESNRLKSSLKKNNLQAKENKKLREKNKEISKENEKLKITENKYNTLYQNNFKLHKKYKILYKLKTIQNY